MATAVSAILTCKASLSASEKTATVSIPILRAVLMIRQAISPRLATRIRLNIPCTAPDAGPLACGVMTKKSIAFPGREKAIRYPERDTHRDSRSRQDIQKVHERPAFGKDRGGRSATVTIVSYSRRIHHGIPI